VRSLFLGWVGWRGGRLRGGGLRGGGLRVGEGGKLGVMRLKRRGWCLGVEWGDLQACADTIVE